MCTVNNSYEAHPVFSLNPRSLWEIIFCVKKQKVKMIKEQQKQVLHHKLKF